MNNAPRILYCSGDWVKIKGIPAIQEIIGIITDYFLIKGEYGWMPLSSIERPATPAEIEAANMKFPFKYVIGNNTFIIENDPINDFAIISGGNLVFINKATWQEIGKRKGWL